MYNHFTFITKNSMGIKSILVIFLLALPSSSSSSSSLLTLALHRLPPPLSSERVFSTPKLKLESSLSQKVASLKDDSVLLTEELLKLTLLEANSLSVSLQDTEEGELLLIMVPSTRFVEVCSFVPRLAPPKSNTINV